MIIGVLTGPTASGKSSLALEWASKNDCEIISADSMQVYQGFRIGTAQPSLSERAFVPHHLVDFLAPHESFSAGDFIAKAIEFHQESKRYLVVGGTGFYLKALLHGLSDIPDIPDSVKLQAELDIENLGLEAVFSKLQELDPNLPPQIRVSDPYRLARAYEVYLATGRNYSSFLGNSKKGAISVPLYSLEMETPVLNRRIQERVMKMIQEGWIQEVEELLSVHPREDRAFGILGYPEIVNVIDRKISLNVAAERIFIKTRQLAKRQRTYLRGQLPERKIIQNLRDFDLRID